MRDYPEAAKESSDYVILQQRLRDLQILKATATGNFRVLVPATVPEDAHRAASRCAAPSSASASACSPASASPSCSSSSTRALRRPEDVAAVLHQPILARIPRLSREQHEVAARWSRWRTRPTRSPRRSG